jgi:hypothetical protein
MAILISTLSVAFAGAIVWLVVRVINRPERFRPRRRHWIVLAISLPFLYVLSFGPACWFNERTSRQVGNGFNQGRGYAVIFWAYRPILHWASQRPTGSEVIYWYAAIGTRDAELGIGYSPTPDGRWTVLDFDWMRDDDVEFGRRDVNTPAPIPDATSESN